MNVRNDSMELVYVSTASNIKNVFRKQYLYVVILLQSLSTNYQT
jgi:hypothetical protein